MTQDQVLSLVRWGIATGGAYFVGKGWVDGGTVTMISGAAATAVPLIWSMFVHAAPTVKN